MHSETHLSNPLLYFGKKPEIRLSRSGRAVVQNEENLIILDREKSIPVNLQCKESNSRFHIRIGSADLFFGLFTLTLALLHRFSDLQFCHAGEMSKTLAAIAQATQKLSSVVRAQISKFAAKPSSFCKLQISGLPESKSRCVTGIPNRDDAKSLLKNRTSTLINEQGTNEKVAAYAKTVSISDGFDLPLETDPIGSSSTSHIHPPQDYDLIATEGHSRSIPIM